jgi:DNA-directed RNA polymerase specialized sigma24 family protein
MNEEEFRTALLKKLDLNNRLQALNLVKNKLSLKEKIEELSSLGIGPSEIADILGTSSNYVNVILSRMRKSQKKEDTSVVVEGEKADEL